MQAPIQTADALFEAYAAAWQAHDVQAILNHHTEDTIFSVMALGQQATGKIEVGERFAALFALWPDLQFAARRLYITPTLIVFESTATGTQAAPIELGGVTVEPTGWPVSFDVVDILPLRDGLICRKDSYIDALGYQKAMRLPAGGAVSHV